MSSQDDFFLEWDSEPLPSRKSAPVEPDPWDAEFGRPNPPATLDFNAMFEMRDPLAYTTGADVGLETAAELNLPPFPSPPAPSLDEWPEPEPLEDALPDIAQFDLELMPESLRPLVKDVADRMQVPLDFPAVAAVATLAGVTNRRAVIQPKRNDHTWTVVPNLWGGIVAPPGMLKSPVLSCMTQPARAIESEWRRAHEEAERNFETALELQELEKAAWKDRAKIAIKGGNKPAPKPETALTQPVLHRLITSDA